MARSTFGLKLSIWSASAYVQVKGLYDGKPPSLKAADPVESTSHDSTNGIAEFIPAGIKEWTDPSFEFNDIPADAGQVAVLAAIGTTAKFKCEAAGVTAPIFFNAIVKSFEYGSEPVKGKGTRSLSLQPTGDAPVS